MGTKLLFVGGLKSEKLLLSSKLIKWYMMHGLKVTRIYEAIEFNKVRCFEEFKNEVTEARIQADYNEDQQVIANTMKLCANACYGSMLIDRSKHIDTVYVEGYKKAAQAINDNQFVRMTELDTVLEYYEVTKKKKSIYMNTPLQLGYFVLQYAKQRLLEFEYDFFHEFVERCDHITFEVDTDGVYKGLSAKTLDEVIKPGKKKEYMDAIYNSCHVEKIIPSELKFWFPRRCCQKHRIEDNRLPGLFKIEFNEGVEGIGLASKSFIISKGKKVLEKKNTNFLIMCAQSLVSKAKKVKCRGLMKRTKCTRCKVGYIHHDCKISSKGVQKKFLVKPLYKFRKVITTGVKQSGINRGIRLLNNRLWTYVQEKDSFTYSYWKRKVQDDGISTRPLDIVLQPRSRAIKLYDLNDEVDLDVS